VFGLDKLTWTNPEREYPIRLSAGVSTLTVQIFVSYARDDDAAPPGRDDLKGFVTHLDEWWRYELLGLGEPRPRIWRDTRKIEAIHQFEPRIQEAIAESAFLLVVLSRSWLERPWCRRELDLFRQRWSAETEEEVRRRIIVVAKHHVPLDRVPTLLQGQEGVWFFELDREDDPGQEQDFFGRGRILDGRYEGRVVLLARNLWRTAARRSTLPIKSDPPPARVPTSGKMIYLAKPAADMRLVYDQLVKELNAAGYGVTPPPASEIPVDATAVISSTRRSPRPSSPCIYLARSTAMSQRTAIRSSSCSWAEQRQVLTRPLTDSDGSFEPLVLSRRRVGRLDVTRSLWWPTSIISSILILCLGTTVASLSSFL